MDIADIPGAKKRDKFSGEPNRKDLIYDVKDINGKRFVSKKGVNPLNPVYDMRTQSGNKIRIGEVEGSKPRVIPVRKDYTGLNLKVDDIKGAKAKDFVIQKTPTSFNSSNLSYDQWKQKRLENQRLTPTLSKNDSIEISKKSDLRSRSSNALSRDQVQIIKDISKMYGQNPPQTKEIMTSPMYSDVTKYVSKLQFSPTQTKNSDMKPPLSHQSLKSSNARISTAMAKDPVFANNLRNFYTLSAQAGKSQTPEPRSGQQFRAKSHISLTAERIMNGTGEKSMSLSRSPTDVDYTNSNRNKNRVNMSDLLAHPVINQDMTKSNLVNRAQFEKQKQNYLF